jgi:tRNA 2-thiouridine synthesizing protein D
VKQLAVLLNVAPDAGAIAEHAIGTIETALSLDHAVFVFCYAEGIGFARGDRDMPQGELDLAEQLHRLAEHLHCQVVSCITASERRGLTEAQLPPSVRMGGLGEWAEAVIESDRVVQFQ